MAKLTGKIREHGFGRAFFGITGISDCMVTSGDVSMSTAMRLAMFMVMCNAASVEGIAVYAQGPKVWVGVPQILYPRCNPVMWVARYAYMCYTKAITCAYL
jgi:hypothetical protein